MKVMIRPYKDSDYPAVEAILKAANQHDEVWDHRENLASMINHDPESVLVAEADGQIVGNIIITGYGDYVSYLFRLSVKEIYKKQGIGTQLLDAACAILKKRGVKEVALAADADREDLIAYYTKRGYQTSKRKYHFMWKKL